MQHPEAHFLAEFFLSIDPKSRTSNSPESDRRSALSCTAFEVPQLPHSSGNRHSTHFHYHLSCDSLVVFLPPLLCASAFRFSIKKKTAAAGISDTDRFLKSKSEFDLRFAICNPWIEWLRPTNMYLAKRLKVVGWLVGWFDGWL